MSSGRVLRLREGGGRASSPGAAEELSWLRLGGEEGGNKTGFIKKKKRRRRRWREQNVRHWSFPAGHPRQY